MGRLLIWLSGASPQILKRCPTERAKYVGIGAAIFVTAMIAGVSMAFALRTELIAPLIIAFPLAIAWGLAIMSLDRWLVVSLPRQENPWGYLVLAIPRLLLGLLIGFVISTPLILQIFRPEINNQIAVIQTQRADSYFAQLAMNPLTRKINADRAAVAALDNTISTGGGPIKNPYRDPTVKSLVQQRNIAASQASFAFGQWQCQLYGLPARSCKAGNGQLAAASHARYLNAIALLNQDNAKIRSVTQQILSADSTARATAALAARVPLLAAKLALKLDISEQRNLIASFDAANARDAGLLLRIQALDDFSKSSTLNVVRLLLFALFTVVELLPIMVKVLLNVAPENTYEKMLALEEGMLLRAAREDALRRQAARSLE
jgi:hypothetical protein